MFFSLLWILSTAAAPAAARPPKLDPSKPQQKCDDILRFAFPDLCELSVEKGSVPVRGVSVTYWRYFQRDAADGKADSPEGNKLPLLLVHGGPGFNHRYLLPMKRQACRGREIVFYDQAGVGESVLPSHLGGTEADVREKAPWLLTIDYYNEEVRALVEHFRWDKFHLFGSSWGTIVGQSYALTQDPRLQAVVLSGPLSDGQLYIKSQWDAKQGNLGSLPLHTQDALHQINQQRAFHSPFYTKADDVLTNFFTVRTVPAPDCFTDAEPETRVGHEIYVGMQGPSEFTVGGVLADFNFTDKLKKIKNSVLLTHGVFDTMRPPVVDAMSDVLPRVWRALLPRSGHCSMIDDPKLMNDVVGEFLDAVERGDGCAAAGGFVVAEGARDREWERRGAGRRAGWWPVFSVEDGLFGGQILEGLWGAGYREDSGGYREDSGGSMWVLGGYGLVGLAGLVVGLASSALWARSRRGRGSFGGGRCSSEDAVVLSEQWCRQEDLAYAE